jgi:hypothetical protein
MIDQYLAMYTPLIPEHIYRWHIPNNVIKWMHNTDMLKRFAVQRPSQIILQLVKNFGIPLKIYSNPSDGKFNIKHFMGDSNEIYIEITSISGVKLYNERITFINGNDIPLKVDLPEGVYLLSLRNENMIFSEKLFVQH